jgi:3-hydroxy-9,10-secoandrosta-1,3,5(10)-triene-9,17-dione monooxygenase
MTAARAEVLSAEEIVRRARALAPAIASRAAQAEIDRRVPKESIDELKASGLCRLYTPERWGGCPNGISAVLPAIIEIAKACTSTGWVFGFINFHAWIVAQYPEEAQAEVWAETPDAPVATSFVPMCKAVAVEGGFRMSGKSPWSSGIHHCGWIAAGAMIEVRPGEFVHNLMLVPKADFTIVDDWYSMGLRGSGSNSVVFEDVFVPAHRVLAFSDLVNATGPGAASAGHPMYQIPLLMGVEGLIAAPLVGAALGAYERYRDWTREKLSSYGGQAVAMSTETQRRLSEAADHIEMSHTVLQAAFARADAGGPYTELDRARHGRVWSWVARTAQRGVDDLFQSGGARILADGNPIQRAWRDVHAISQHLALGPYPPAIQFARLELGLGRDPMDSMY